MATLERFVGLWLSLLLAATACGKVSTNSDAAPPDDTDAAALPDFTVATGVVRLDARVPSVVELEVTVERVGGFDASVVVSISDLPTGVSANSVTVPPDSSTRVVEIDAAGGAPGTLAEITIVGTAGDLVRTADLELFLVGPSGTLDVTFGTDGEAALPPDLTSPTVRSTIPLPDGTFLLTGSASEGMFVVRYLGDGTLDSSYGTDGLVIVGFADLGIPAVTGGVGSLQGDDKLVLAGHGRGEPVEDEINDIGLARLTADGSLDEGFAGNGRVVHKFGTRNVTSAQLTIDPGGRIVISGRELLETPTLFVARFTADGLLDASFGSGGLTTFGSNHFSSDVAVAPNGRLLVTSRGACGQFGCSGFLFGFNDNGSPDTSLDGDGRVDFGFNQLASRIVPLPDGDLLLSATEGLIVSTPLVYRLESDGSFKAGFGTDGKAEIPLEEGRGGSVTHLVLDGGRVVLLGASILEDFSEPELVLARLESADGSLDPTFGSEGVASASRASLTISNAGLAVRTEHQLIVVQSRLPADGGPFIVQFWQ